MSPAPTRVTAACTTVSSAVPVTPSTSASIDTAPRLTASTRPSFVTVATDGSRLDHATVRPTSGCPAGISCLHRQLNGLSDLQQGVHRLYDDAGNRNGSHRHRHRSCDAFRCGTNRRRSGGEGGGHAGGVDADRGRIGARPGDRTADEDGTGRVQRNRLEAKHCSHLELCDLWRYCDTRYGSIVRRTGVHRSA